MVPLWRPSQEILKIRDVARILVFKIRTSKEILKIRDGTPLEAEGILTYRKTLDTARPSQEILKIRDVARILVFKINPSKEILKIRDGTPLKAEGILTYRKSPRNCSVWHFFSKLYVPCNVVQKKEWHGFWFSKLGHLKKFLKFVMVPLEAEGILTYRKSPRNCSVWHFSSKLDVPSNVVQKKRVAWILLFKIRPSQEILKIRDGTPLEAEGILTYRKKPLHKKRVARILVFKIRPSQHILKIRDGTPLEAEGVLTYRKGHRNCSVLHFSSKLDVPSNVVQKKRVARILVFKIRPSKEILKIRDGTPLEAEGILTYRKSPRNCSVWHFFSKLYVPCNVVQKKEWHGFWFSKLGHLKKFLKFVMVPFGGGRNFDIQKKPSKLLVAWILVFKIRPSQKILKIRDGTPLKEDGILTYRKSPQNCSVWHFSSKLDVPSNVVQKKRVACIMVFKIRPSQEILKIRDGTPLEAEGILTYRKALDTARFGTFLKRVARILLFKIRPSQEILKIRDGTPLEMSSQEILEIRDGHKKRVARILVFKIRTSKEILKIRDGTPLKAEGILTYRKSPRNCSFWHFSSKLDVPSNVVQKKRLARILVFKIRSSQEILKIRDGTPLEAEEFLTYRKALDTARFGTFLSGMNFLTYRKSPRNCSIWHFSSKLDVPSNVVQKERVAWILVFKIRPSQKILKIRDGTPLKAKGILTYRKSPRNCSFWHFSSKLDVPSNVVQKKRLARILVFKIRSSQEILKIRDGTPLEAEEILTYRKALDTARFGTFLMPSQEILKIRDDTSLEILKIRDVARILLFKIRPSQEILKIRDGTPLEAEGILTYRKSPRYCSLDVPSNVVQKKRVARILLFKIRPSQEILKIRDGTPLELDVPSNVVHKKRVARILVFKIRPSKEILKIRDGTPLEAEGILTYRKSPRNCSVWHFSSKLDVPGNIVHKERVAWILVFKIRPSQKILKIRDGTPLKEDGILTYRKSPQNCSVWHFSSKLDVPSNVVQKKRVACIMVFKIRPSQEILKIRDGTPLEAEGILTYRKKPPKLLGILTYRKSPRNCSVWHFSSKLDVPGNIVHKERVAWILVFKIRPSQKILKIRDGTPLKEDGILTYRKSPQNCSVWHFSSKLDVPSNVVQKKRVACIMVFKIRPSQEILKIRDGTPLEAEGILTYRKALDTARFGTFLKRVARILLFKIRPSQEILKIRDGSPLEMSSQEILEIRDGHKKRVARILVFKIRTSKEILKIRDGTPLKAEGILTYRKTLETARFGLARILVFKIRSSQEILKIRDGTPLEAEEILTYRKALDTARFGTFLVS
ncbi:hypothetical protein OROMI_024527 [Orobanche minor]